MTGPAITIRDLTRVYGRGETAVTALDKVSFDVRYGQIVALLGSNGAGKTTLIKVLATLLLPSAGSVTVAGHDVVRQPKPARAVAGVVFGGDRGLYGRLTLRDNLRYFGMLAGLARRDIGARIDQALAEVNLSDLAGRRVEALSRGMRQRLHLAIGLIRRPRVLLLDEPTVGLDPVEAERVRAIVARLRDEGVGVLLTSHYLVDVERLAGRVVLLSDAKVAADMAVDEFARTSGFSATVTVRGKGPVPDWGSDPAKLVVQATSARGDADGWEVDLRVREWSAAVFRHLSSLFDGVTVYDVKVRETGVEEAFLAISRRAAP